MKFGSQLARNGLLGVCAAILIASGGCNKKPTSTFSRVEADHAVSGDSQYPVAVDPARVGTYDAGSKSGAGYFYDDVLEYRVWLHPERGARQLNGSNDYYAAFAQYERADVYSRNTKGSEEPLALVRQREWIDEPQPGQYRAERGERITEWRVQWLDSKRTETSIRDFLAHPPRSDEGQEQPLSKQVKSLTTTELIDRLAFKYSDRLLIDELLQRDLSDNEFDRLMFAQQPAKGNKRYSLEDKAARIWLVLREIGVLDRDDVREPKVYEPKLRRVLKIFASRPKNEELLARTFLSTSRNIPHLDLSEDALRFVSQGRFVEESLGYLSYCGRTTRTYERLKGLPVPDDVLQEKTNALGLIYLRIVKKYDKCG